jgi:hypothetical protein
VGGGGGRRGSAEGRGLPSSKLCVGSKALGAPRATAQGLRSSSVGGGKKRKVGGLGDTEQGVATGGVLCECGSGAPRRRALRGSCLCSNPPGKRKEKEVFSSPNLTGLNDETPKPHSLRKPPIEVLVPGTSRGTSTPDSTAGTWGAKMRKTALQ